MYEYRKSVGFSVRKILAVKVRGELDCGIGETVMTDFLQKLIQHVGIADANAEKRIVQPDDVMMFDDGRLLLAENAEVVVFARRNIDLNKGVDPGAELRFVDLCVKTLDDTGVTEPVDALGHGRSGQTDETADLAGWSFAVVLKNVDDFDICLIHYITAFPCERRQTCMMIAGIRIGSGGGVYTPKIYKAILTQTCGKRNRICKDNDRFCFYLFADR